MARLATIPTVSAPAAVASSVDSIPTPHARRELTRIALVGNPNSGKSSLFNQLTGLNQKVGNFPGVTVDRKTGISQLTPQHRAEIIDLPGTYSLYPKSLDEKVITDLLYDRESAQYPDFVVVTVDASNLRRNLLLFTQLADLGLPAVLALNMMDVAEQHGVHIDIAELQQELGVPVIPMNARKGIGVAALKIVMAQHLDAPTVSFYEPTEELLPMIRQIRYYFNLHNDYLALHYAHQFRHISFLTPDQRQYVQELVEQYGFEPTARQAHETISRYARINEILLNAVSVTRTERNEPYSNKLDKVLTHRVWGYLIFFGVLFMMFQAVFAWASYPMDLIDQGIALINSLIQTNFNGPLINLLTEGVIAGLGGVLIFIPQIALLFAFIAVLEETGYMARVTFMMDRIMRKFGLNGKSVVPLISGVACAVPAIMSARTIENWKDRIITIFVTPLMSCSARIPVYTVLTALVVPDEKVLGFFNLQGVVLMGLYLLGFLSAIFSALALKLLLKTQERSYFIMEFPVYRWPRWKNVGITIVEKVKTFVFQAGKVIVAISVILWVLASYGPGDALDKAEQQARVTAVQQQLTPEETDNRIASEKLENSYAGLFGRTLEPAIRPLGFDWKIGIALITSFAAREVFVGTISTIYSVGQDADMRTVQQKLAAEKDENGQPFFTPARAFSLLVFYVFAMQCMSTLAVVYRETKGWKWPLMQLLYMTGLAYVSSLIVYQVFK
ncbi:ferrous iron transport protein B [Hymenobacter qilianensis]|uniref:Ferrous iron transport protein B n=2 Tax=Hymenobacter qilianensis TaxID=1385715 RepID=A0ACB5PPV5_9BACT|nr:ferrous iron transport protein B [Hymenobacter qilianensis]QNP53049.1 ferrous iron transport protein B [Hymenobacter qilianensis]GGF60286.1 ferrous iron transport protein B [Hymenobacter qilianensis]